MLMPDWKIDLRPFMDFYSSGTVERIAVSTNRSTVQFIDRISLINQLKGINYLRNDCFW